MTLYRQCNDLSSHRSTHQWIWSYIHVQLVSLLQWHDNVFNNKQIFELVSILKSQWVCFNDILNAMIYSFSSLYLSVNLTRHRVHVQLVSLLQWHLSSMQWLSYLHRSTHQWTWSNVHVQLVSLLQWRAQSRSLRWASRLVSLLQWHDHLR